MAFRFFIIHSQNNIELRQKITRVMQEFNSKVEISDLAGRIIYVGKSYPMSSYHRGWVTRRINELVRIRTLTHRFLIL